MTVEDQVRLKRTAMAACVAAAGLAATPQGAAADCAPFFIANSGASLSGDAFCNDDPDFLSTSGGEGDVGAFTIIDGASVTLGDGLGVDIATGPGESGDGLISGAGSSLTLSTGAPSRGVGIGGNGGLGRLTIEDGGALTLSREGGEEGAIGVSVGALGGVGALMLDAGSLLLDDAVAAAIHFGDKGGVGVATLTNGSDMTLRATDATDGGGNTDLVVGANFDGPASEGGVGRVTVQDSTINVLTPNEFAGFDIASGDGTTGHVTVTGADAAVSVAAAEVARLGVGLAQASVGVFSAADGAAISVVAEESSQVFIGEDGSASLSFIDGAALDVGGAETEGAAVLVGLNAGGVGDLTVSAASMTILGGDDASFDIGVRGAGAATITDGATVTMGDASAENARLVVGDNDGGVGALRVSNDAVVSLDGEDTDLRIGQWGGATGAVEVTDGGRIEVTGEESSQVIIGEDGSASLSFSDGAALDVGGAETEDAAVLVGLNAGGVGDLTVSAASMTILGDDASFDIGERGAGAATITDGATVTMGDASAENTRLVVGDNDGGVGALRVSNGAVVSLDGKDTDLRIGQSGGATGAVEVTDGGRIEVTGEEGAVRVAAAFGAIRPVAGTASLLISGEGSSVEATNSVTVGAPAELGPASATGRLTVRDGGVLTAPTVTIGLGGLLDGDGVIDGSLIVDGGVVSPGNSPGLLTVNGDFTITDGLLELEFAGADPGAFDVIDVSGDFLGRDAGGALAPFDIRFTFLDGFVPGSGDSFNFLQIAGDSGDLDALFAMSLIGVETAGLPSGSSVDLDFSNGVLSASFARVPLPAAAWMLVGALAALGLQKARRTT